jgi:hypothetical protein
MVADESLREFIRAETVPLFLESLALLAKNTAEIN